MWNGFFSGNGYQCDWKCTENGFQSIISSQVSKSEQGELQGGLSSLLGLATIIAPPLLTMVLHISQKIKIQTFILQEYRI